MFKPQIQQIQQIQIQLLKIALQVIQQQQMDQ